MPVKKNPRTSRRHFLGAIASSTAALTMASFATPLHAGAKTLDENLYNNEDPDAWFNKIKGKHRIVFDVTKPYEVFAFAWPKVFLLTNEATGTPPKDNSVVVIFRHEGIPYAFNEKIWQEYKFGEMFKVDDPRTKTAAMRNPFWQPMEADFKFPGVGPVPIGINQLQDEGVMFCVCNVAMTVYSAAIAEKMGKDAAQVKKDWTENLLPGIQVVPSGVWAVGRAQEHGCAYCFVG
jgi:intracellular sulfur oxidation DsrE/DsrF family protein